MEKEITNVQNEPFKIKVKYRDYKNHYYDLYFKKGEYDSDNKEIELILKDDFRKLYNNITSLTDNQELLLRLLGIRETTTIAYYIIFFKYFEQYEDYQYYKEKFENVAIELIISGGFTSWVKIMKESAKSDDELQKLKLFYRENRKQMNDEYLSYSFEIERMIDNARNTEIRELIERENKKAK